MNQIDKFKSNLQRMVASGDYRKDCIEGMEYALLSLESYCTDLLNKPLVDARTDKFEPMTCINCNHTAMVFNKVYCCLTKKDIEDVAIAGKRADNCPIQWSETTEKASKMLNAQYGNKE